MKEMNFTLGYTRHRLWGSILQAIILEKDSGKEFSVPQEYVQNDETTKAFQRLTPRLMNVATKAHMMDVFILFLLV